MKKILFLLSFQFAILSFNLIAQASQKFNYQGVARDNSGNVLANQNISLRLTIHQGTITGTVVYQ